MGVVRKALGCGREGRELNGRDLEGSNIGVCDLAGQYRNTISGLLLTLSVLCSVLLSPLVLAQHDMHGMAGSDGLLASTMPADDEVLASAPQSIMLNFASEVRLVKLALKETKQGEVLIDFRYDSTAAMRYRQALPALAAANYYKVEWAALKADGELVKGSFYFSFGDDAKPASDYMQGMDHDMQVISPDYRLL